MRKAEQAVIEALDAGAASVDLEEKMFTGNRALRG